MVPAPGGGLSPGSRSLARSIVRSRLGSIAFNRCRFHSIAVAETLTIDSVLGKNVGGSDSSVGGGGGWGAEPHVRVSVCGAKDGGIRCR